MELIKEHLTRQMDIIPLDSLKRKITVIGAGAIGSMTILALAKMGYEDITVYDFDKVDIENINSQFYRFKDIGKYKVIALQEIIKDFTNVDIKIINKKYEGEKFTDIIICAVDNMATRKEIYKVNKENFLCNFLVDPRMAIEFAYIQGFNPNVIDECNLYEKTLHTDEDSVQERCTNKSTIYTSQLIGATIAKMVKDISNNKKHINRIMWDIEHNNVMMQKNSA